MRAGMTLVAAAAVASVAAQALRAQTPVTPCEIVVPVLDTGGAPVLAAAPDGRTYPVFRLAPPSPLVASIRVELDGSFAQQVLRLDRLARNLVAAGTAPGVAPDEWLTGPMVLLLSGEEGGFARFGFWLEDSTGTRWLVRAGYVDLVVRESGVASGNFEEIFSHELGHLILRALVGDPAPRRSSKMHLSMAVTDQPTAFDEGFAEHFQPLVRDATRNPALRRQAAGTAAGDLETLWLSAAENELRSDGVKRNLFVHRTALPASALEPRPDRYRVFSDAQTSTAFLPGEVRSGQEMMASEGVVATLFYRMVNDSTLRSRWREPSFYAPFLGAAPTVPAAALSPYENASLKLFAALAATRGTDVRRPPMVRLVEQYARLFPDEARRIEALFVETTWGATVSRPAAFGLARAAATGRRGDLAAFRSLRPFGALDSAIAAVAAGRLALDAAVGPELWVTDTAFRIAPAVWDARRTVPLTLNLNTASVAEWMTVPGVDLAMARRILRLRDERGWLASLEELRAAGVPPAVVARLARMRSAFDRSALP